MGRDFLGSLLLLLQMAIPAWTQLGVARHPDIQGAVEHVSREEIERTVARLVGFGTRHTLSTTDDPERGIGAAERWLAQRLQEISAETGGRLQVTRERHQVPPSRRVPGGTEVVNVVATLPGSDRDRYLIVSGHYDSRASRALDAESAAPGADDDASGVAAVLETARVLGHLRPRATLQFIAFSGEEQGLLGAAAHATAARAASGNVAAMITNDIIGGVRGSNGRQEPMRVRLFSEGLPSGPLDERGRPPRNIVGSDNDAPSRQLARYLRARGEAYVPGFEVTLIFRQDRFLRGGDHKAFNDQGYAAVRFSEVHENYDWQHQDVRQEGDRRYGDRPENLDYDYVRRVTQVNVAGLAEMALAPSSPRQVRLLIATLSPDTELRWAPNPEEDLGGYGILLRRTHEPDWTERRTIPRDQTTVVLEGLSKDDWIFAVEAFDTEGRRSLPVYPTPAQR